MHGTGAEPALQAGGGEIAAGLVYTICFCLRGDAILMLHRDRPPFARHWNGLGGKLEPGETPLACVEREVLEESGLRLRDAQAVRFAGLVTWSGWSSDGAAPVADRSRGMYAYVARFPDAWPIWDGARPGPDGRLAWQPLAWVCDPNNGTVVDNLPQILPRLLAEPEPLEYHCAYAGHRLVEVVAHPLPTGLLAPSR